MSVQGQDGTLAIEGALAPQVEYRGLRRSPTTTLERRRGRHALMALATALTLERTDAHRI